MILICRHELDLTSPGGHPLDRSFPSLLIFSIHETMDVRRLATFFEIVDDFDVTFHLLTLCRTLYRYLAAVICRCPHIDTDSEGQQTNCCQHCTYTSHLDPPHLYERNVRLMRAN